MKLSTRSGKNYSMEQGLEAYAKHVKQCKAEGREPASLEIFFSYYDPKTLKIVIIGTPPLKKYVEKYQRKMEKLQKKSQSGLAKK